jgi:superfamily II DNA or RNA helicase
VDVPAVDMVAFVDPRKSKIDIAQAAGRAMRQSKATNKKLGYIVVPLFIEQKKGETEAEEEMAGVEVFRRFGSFPTIDRLAITYGITHDEVLEMPAEIVMTKLLYDLEKAEYDERLMKIKTTK